MHAAKGVVPIVLAELTLERIWTMQAPSIPTQLASGQRSSSGSRAADRPSLWHCRHASPIANCLPGNRPNRWHRSRFRPCTAGAWRTPAARSARCGAAPTFCETESRARLGIHSAWARQTGRGNSARPRICIGSGASTSAKGSKCDSAQQSGRQLSVRSQPPHESYSRNINPPSTERIWPVIQLDSSDSRNASVDARSWG
jgi:hypothetical protein